MKNMEELNKTNEMDINYFWKTVNKCKSKSKSLHPIKLAEDDIVTDPDILIQKWQDYFQTLYMPHDKDGFDNDFRSYVENKLNEYAKDANLIMDDILKHEFTNEEIVNVLKSLKRNKAPGWDNITAEHII